MYIARKWTCESSQSQWLCVRVHIVPDAIRVCANSGQYVHDEALATMILHLFKVPTKSWHLQHAQLPATIKLYSPLVHHSISSAAALLMASNKVDLVFVCWNRQNTTYHGQVHKISCSLMDYLGGGKVIVWWPSHVKGKRWDAELVSKEGKWTCTCTCKLTRTCN